MLPVFTKYLYVCVCVCVFDVEEEGAAAREESIGSLLLVLAYMAMWLGASVHVT